MTKVVQKSKNQRAEALTAPTKKLEVYHSALQDPSMHCVIALGYPGTGKTKTFAYFAAKTYRAGQCREDSTCKKIILLRPNVGCGDDIGFLPGDEFEKTYPFHVQVLNYLSYYFEMSVESLLTQEIVEIQSFWTLQGRDLSDCWVFVDEAQNMTIDDMYILATRGASKFICSGDVSPSQILNMNNTANINGLKLFQECMAGLPYVTTIVFDSPDDILRPGIVKDAILRMTDRIAKIKESEPQRRYRR